MAPCAATWPPYATGCSSFRTNMREGFRVSFCTLGYLLSPPSFVQSAPWMPSGADADDAAQATSSDQALLTPDTSDAEIQTAAKALFQRLKNDKDVLEWAVLVEHFARHKLRLISGDVAALLSDDKVADLVAKRAGKYARKDLQEHEFVDLVSVAQDTVPAAKAGPGSVDAIASRIQRGLHSEVMRWASRTAYQLLALLQQVFWLLLMSIFIQPNLLIMAIVMLEIVLVALCLKNVGRSVDFYIRKTETPHMWARFLSLYHLLPDPNHRYYRHMLRHYLYCLLAAGLLLVLVPYALEDYSFVLQVKWCIPTTGMNGCHVLHDSKHQTSTFC